MNDKNKITIRRKERDSDTYKWYLNFVAKNGRSPTLIEAGDFLDCTRERARQIFNRMERYGYLIRVSKKKKINFIINPLIKRPK